LFWFQSIGLEAAAAVPASSQISLTSQSSLLLASGLVSAVSSLSVLALVYAVHQWRKRRDRRLQLEPEPVVQMK